MLQQELSRSIIGAGMTVLNTLKPGRDEKLYERALKIELENRGHVVEVQREFPVYYDGQEIGTLIPDLIVDDLVLVDTKVVRAFNESHEAQILGYLAITGLRVGLIINFKYRSLEWKRIAR
jgi:GxxExxY protein